MLCVERVGHKNGVRNAYVARQERIEGQLPVHTGTRFGDIEVSDLRFGVNARVGPSCTVHMDALAEHVSHGVLNWERRKNDESPDPRSAKTAGLTVQYQGRFGAGRLPLSGTTWSGVRCR